MITDTENFHFRRLSDKPVIVVGAPDQTFLSKRAVPLKLVTNATTEVTETGQLVGVTKKGQVRLKLIHKSEDVAKIPDTLR